MPTDLSDSLDATWQQALGLWSPWLSLGPPRICETGEEIAAAGLQGRLAQFRLSDRLVMLNGPLLRARGLGKQLLAVLAHEIGHYACCPGSPELHARLSARAFAALRATRPAQVNQTALVVNLFEDLLINTRLQLEKRLDLLPLLRALRGHERDAFWDWVLRLHELRWRLPAGSLAESALEATAEADALLAAGLIRPQSRRLGDEIDAFARLCAAYLPEAAAELPWLDLPAEDDAGLPAGLTQAPPDSDLLAELSGEGGRGKKLQPAHQQVLEPPDYAALLQQAGYRGTGWLAQYYRELAWPWLLPEPPLGTNEPTPDHPEGTLPWELDRPLSDIDWTASLVQSPVPVPGMTTLRRRMAHEPEPEGARPLARLDLYLDASGSVPDPARVRSPLVLAAAILALSALRLGMAVRATCFSGAGELTGTAFSQHSQSLLETLTGYPGGATSFPSALLAQRYASPDPEAQVVILSDEGWRALLEAPEGGVTGLDLLSDLPARCGGCVLLLQLLRPELTPPELTRLLRAGWRLEPLDPEQPASLGKVLL